jgi:PAS domain S-box-containing protein
MTPPSVVTDRHQQDADLFRLLVDRVLDYAIFLLTPDGHIASWNAGAERLKGYTADEIIGQSFEVFYTPEDRAAGRPKRLLGIARDKGRVEDEGFRVRKNNSRFWADVVITALRDDSGKLVGFAKVTRDLTELRQAERERAQRMSAERAAQRFARLQATTAALAAASRQHEVAQILAGLARADSDGSPGSANGENSELDADERAYLLALSEVGAQAMERARLYESEQQARTEAEAAVRAQDEFLSIASHELRTPVAAVKATAQLAQRAIERGDHDRARLDRYMERIASAADRLNALIEDLLDVSRLRTGQLQLRPERFDLVPLMQEIVDRYAASVNEHTFQFSSPATPVSVYADALRIEQVLDNLLSNAVKYSPNGGDIEIDLSLDGEGACATVTDHGIGLPAGHETRIFETFGRAPNAAREQIPGLGLGLSICRQLIERHGGRISATSPGEDQGTTLAIWLPTDERR